MKTLILVRHAKSSWDDPGLPDRDRPLNDRGKRDAPRMGEQLARHDVKPDVILSSPAARALATAQLIARKLDYKRADIRVDDRLYAVEADDLLQVVCELGDQQKCAMLVGHRNHGRCQARPMPCDRSETRCPGRGRSRTARSAPP